MSRDVVLVFKIRIAQELLQMGYQIVEVRSNLKQPQKTVFVFKEEGNIWNDFKRVREETWEK